ncbi:MAG: hypothetical protein LBL66_08975 [Clostridiales bacterium]|jgi:hypothetical protein|nr:hypothetical protein [Clostridiales bacterium]
MKKVIDNKFFILGYRVAAFIIITFGLLTTVGAFNGRVSFYMLFAYTIQSNILVLIFFAVLIAKTAVGIARRDEVQNKNYGFYPVVAFAIAVAIFITMLIFWSILVPLWGGKNLMTFSNLGVHLFCPLLMIIDRVLFYKLGAMTVFQPLSVLVFPYIYIIQSFSLGLSRAFYFEPMGIQSYYIYPFLDFDAHGYWVLLYIFGLTVFFLGLCYAVYFAARRLTRNANASRK